MEIKQASQTTFDPRPQMSHIFVEGFYTWIKHICKDKEKLTKLFTHMFDLEQFILALEGQQVAAMAACTNGTSPVRLSRNVFTQVLGPMRGNISYIILRRHMMNNSLPFTISPKTGVIEFVATAPEFRNQGVGYTLLTNMMAALPYNSYMLEVADNNIGAMRLYAKLGFKEFKRVKAPKRTRVNEFIYMRCPK